jgi:hypothetical protein
MAASMTDHSARSEPRLRQRISADPDSVERDLVKLVLTIVELLRQLVERQALRRIDAGDLEADEEERVGLTLMLLDDRMSRLLERFEIARADLNLDLGPLGSLLPRGSEASSVAGRSARGGTGRRMCPADQTNAAARLRPGGRFTPERDLG